MKIRIWTFCAAASLILVVNASATTLNGDCSVRFFGQSTLHDFEGQVACQPFIMQTEESSAGRRAVESPVVTVRVSEMNTENTSRDQKMRTMFDHENFPEIKGQLVDFDPEAILRQLESGEIANENLEFSLQIRGITQRIKAKAREVKVSPEQIGVLIEFPLSLASFDLKPPSVMGIIRVADEVRVEVQTTLHRKPPPEVSAAEKEK